MNTAHTVGSKYEATQRLRIADIAKLVRADIKAAIAAGEIPVGTKVSVRSETFAGGCALRVSVTACPVQIHTDEFVAADPGMAFEGDRFTSEAVSICQRITAITKAYNYDDSDTQSDHFDVRFYDGRAEFDWQLRKADRERIAARLQDERREARNAAERAETLAESPSETPFAAPAPVAYSAEQMAICGCY